VYKSDWTDAHSVANALEYVLAIPARRRAGERLAPFRVERLDYRDQDRDAFYRGLERNGPKAVREFRAAFG
ncbi:MAG TPA: deiodinase-related protein, partial [Thermomicrobiales bacterium]|nr:deiodinase-related protein [Thermomicrobiales bacterium]